MKKTSALVIALLFTLSLPAAAERPGRAGDDGSNVLVRLTLADGEHDRPIQALVLDGERIRTTTGWRVPTATTVSGSVETGDQATEFVYQNVGMGVTLQVRVVGPGRIRVSGEVDLGTIESGEAATPALSHTPTIATFRHVFDVIVADGLESTLAEVPKPGGGSATLTITATIQH